jgi:hypothetical protein
MVDGTPFDADTSRIADRPEPGDTSSVLGFALWCKIRSAECAAHI